MSQSPWARVSGEAGRSLVVATEDFVLYRARRPDGRLVLVKVPASDPSPASAVRRLEHELEVARDLNPALVVRPLEILRETGQTALLLEDCPYPTLAEHLDAPLAPEQFLRVAIGMATALADVHGHGLVHKDLTPANVFASAGGEVKLTGFGLASRLPREHRTAEPPEIITGTLAYMAPEQTGRMNRSVDSRSDLYALGVLFYQMLAGRLPFTAADAMEWVHCHIALQPEPPRQHVATIPEPLSDIVGKLLAKDAEDRYQTAEGLKADLERCAAEWRERGRIARFPLGGRDIPDRLLIPERLYGRGREVAALLSAFDRVVSTGRTELVLVAGYAGVGKSAVVSELHRALVPHRGLFASGKFDQYGRGIPYSTLAQAFERLVRPLLGRGEPELQAWRRALCEALEPHGRLIADLVPDLKLIVGEQSAVPELEPRQARARLELVFRRFIGVFARPEHPLALFLDDLQWLDDATIELIGDLLTQEDVRHLLLIGAYRDNEVGPDHPLRRKVDALRGAGAAVQEIALAPLALEDLTRLVSDALRCEPGRAGPLAQLIHGKTAGNPFFALQFLSALAQEELVAFDRVAARWSWDSSRIRAKGYTDNVADLMTARLGRLPARAQSVLQQLACLGDATDVRVLSCVLETGEEEVRADVREAVLQELVQESDGVYRFVHDRVREAAYSLIPEASRPDAHLRIGRRLVALTPPEKREETVFEIVNQLNRGMAVVTSREEREDTAWRNLAAGKRARASAAYDSALSYFAKGTALLADDRWERRHELAFALEIGRAECEFLTGELAAAERRLTELSTRATEVVERAAVARLLIDLCTTRDQNSRAVAVGLDYLRGLGIDWQPHPTEEQARREYERVWATLGDRRVEDLVELPLMSDPESQATLDVLARLTPPALFTDAHLDCLVVCRAVNLSIERGNGDASCIAYVSLGMIAGPQLGDYQAGFRFGQLGYDLVERRGLTRFQPATYMIFGSLVLPWTRHIRAGRDLLLRALKAAKETGDLAYAGYLCDVLGTSFLAAGDPLGEVQRELEGFLEFARRIRFGLVIDTVTHQLALVRTLRGSTRVFGIFDDELLNEVECERRLSGNPDLALLECTYLVHKLMARFFAADHETALVVARRVEQLLWTSPSEFETAEYHLYGALTRAACCDSGTGDRRQHLEALAVHHHQLRMWAEHCPANFENRAALVGAEIARLEDRPLEAMRLYELACDSAHANGFVHNEAVANELAGRFYLGCGLQKNGRAHLRDARACYARWGADGKVKQLDVAHPWLPERTAPERGAIAAHPEQLDVAAIVKAQRAISGEITQAQLAETLLRIVMENAGAQKGYLVVEPCSELYAVSSGGGQIEFSPAPSPSFPGVARSILNYVKRTGAAVLLADASTDAGDFSADEHLVRETPRSVLCLPILRQTRFLGAVYLENDLTAGAFTVGRRAVLEMLAAQAAISLEIARTYDEVRESEAKYRRIVDTAAEGILGLAPDGTVTYVNASMASMLGYAAGDMTGRSITGFMCEEDKPDLPSWMQARVGAPNRCEWRFRREDGQAVWAVVSVAPVLDGAQQPVGTLAMLTDITMRKRAEEELLGLNQVLEQRIADRTALLESSNRELEAFAYSVSHDLRAPLRHVQGFVKLLEDRIATLLDDQSRRYMATISNSAERMRKLIDDLLSFSRMARVEMAERRVDLGALAREVIEELTSEATGRRIDWRLGELPTVVGDRAMLRLVLVNLLSNALKFTRERERAQIEIGCRTEAGAQAEFFVRDNGVGFDMAHVGRLFGVFQRLHAISRFEGTGIGLANVRRIITRHGGRTRAEGAPDRGATFYFTLPTISGLSPAIGSDGA